MNNSIIYDIDEIFPIDSEFTDLYHNQLSNGITLANKSNIRILCLARNIKEKYKYTLRKIRLLLEYFGEKSEVHIYENDSLDGTASLIQEYIGRDGYEKFNLYSEKLETPYMPLSKSQIRTTNMAKARNKCYDLSQTSNTSFDYYMVMDCDFLDLSINGVLNSFGWMASNDNISAICGNSYINFPSKTQDNYRNYDSFAFRLNYWEYHETLWFPYFNLPIGSYPISIFSGFGGSAIYKSKYKLNLYSGETCEHVMLHKNLRNSYDDFRMYYNPSQIMIVD